MSQPSLRDRLLVSTLAPAERENGRRFLSALSLVEGKLRRVEDELLTRTRSPIPTIGEIGDYLVEGGGKRIRPALLLLSARVLGYEGERDVAYAAVIELIHTATLVHDDIIDAAEIRRGRASVNRRWGNELTVLFGDYLYMRSMEIALEEGDLRVLRLLSDVTLEMTEGEIVASESRGSVDIDLSSYLDIVRRKTALLFAAACRIPSFLVDADRQARAMWDFGLALGTAFQLQDDLLDYTASEKELGKPVLSDAREGKLTLPLLLSFPRATPTERKLIERLVGGDAGVAPLTVLEIVHRHGGLERAQEIVDQHAERARELALSLPDSDARDGLLLASEYAARRRK
jgi:octaprenyl-diphosphate synthase